jgi:hypothetical protein
MEKKLLRKITTNFLEVLRNNSAPCYFKNDNLSPQERFLSLIWTLPLRK